MTSFVVVAIGAVAMIKMTYFPIAGRGELARLYAAAGGLEIIDDTNVTLGGTYKTSTPFGFLPILVHQEVGLLLQESLAVERYIAAFAPRFNTLTIQQRAIDDQFACAKEDLMAVEACAGNASIARSCVPPILEHHFGVLEKLVPASGFVNGLSFPTGADLATLIVAEAGFPWGRAMRLANYSWARRFPKLHALAQRTASAPEVADYLATSTTFYARRDPEPSELRAVDTRPVLSDRAACSSSGRGLLPALPAWTRSTAAMVTLCGTCVAVLAWLAYYRQRHASSAEEQEQCTEGTEYKAFTHWSKRDAAEHP